MHPLYGDAHINCSDIYSIAYLRIYLVYCLCFAVALATSCDTMGTYCYLNMTGSYRTRQSQIGRKFPL